MLTKSTHERRLRNAEDRVVALTQALSTHERRIELATKRLDVAKREVEWLKNAPYLDDSSTVQEELPIPEQEESSRWEDDGAPYSE